jgi:glucosyl-3-phosphoglycerate synthase
MQRTIVVGDSRDDRCMVGHAGKGIAFCTKDDLLATIASTNIRENSFQSLLAFA